MVVDHVGGGVGVEVGDADFGGAGVDHVVGVGGADGKGRVDKLHH